MATCPTCAHLTAEGQRFCPSCGAALAVDGLPTGTAPRPVDRPHPSPDRSRSPGPRTPPLSPRTPGSPSKGLSGLTGLPAGAPAPRFVPGALLAERYRIVALLGRGGMGEVYRADDLRLGQAVALKFLPDSLKEDEGRRERFHNEVRTARQVSHPAVCRVYDIGELEGQPFLTMEYVDGEDLASLLRRIGRLPPDKAEDIARQLCAGLAAAHERGVLHRDLKPDNIMLDGRGKVRITDFGLSGLAESFAGDEVRSGTPAYMSPEQLAGREVTAASDIYALGLLLYELFTGRKPYEGRTLAELIRKHEETTPASPSLLVHEIDPAVEAVILRCLENDPRLRPSSPLAVAAALPGGDPLAAALAAGEIPSPEMVAAAGTSQALSARAAQALLALSLGALALCPFVAPAAQLGGLVPMDKAPAALEDRAREVLRALGPDVRAADFAAGLSVDSDYLQYQAARDLSPGRWNALASGRPPVLRYWYRQSPRPMASTWIAGTVYWTNPPPLVSGMGGVQLDMQGRLVGYYVVPPQMEAAADPSPAAPDWSPLFAQARLDAARFTPVPPLWTPPFFSDTRAAWEGTDPVRPDLPVRIEAAAYRGRPVSFQMIGPWTRAERAVPFQFTPGQKASHRLGFALLLACVLGAAHRARQNVRDGRGDRRGAMRLATATFLVMLARWVITADHVPDMAEELLLAIRGLGLTLVVTAFLWVVYLALEPYVRRSWPETLVSWTRILSGRLRDPAVGRDLLVGTCIGSLFGFVVFLIRTRLLPALGLPAPIPLIDEMDVLLGTRQAVGALLYGLVVALTNGLGAVLLRVGLRRVLRGEAWAALVFAVLLSLQFALSAEGPFWLLLTIAVVANGLPFYYLVRQGVLAAVVAIFVVQTLLVFPATTSLSHWSAPTMFIGLGVVAALAVEGYRLARPAYR
jgi:serine/threonine-protein kinase